MALECKTWGMDAQSDEMDGHLLMARILAFMWFVAYIIYWLVVVTSLVILLLSNHCTASIGDMIQLLSY